MAKLSSLNILTKNIPLGFIPVGKSNNNIAEFLGLGFEEEASNILSARRIQKLDLGLANNYYFLSQATINSRGTTIEIDKDYSIEIMGPGKIGVINLPIDNNLSESTKANAKDGVLELFISTKTGKKYLPLASHKTKQSIFSFNKLRIFNKNQPVLIDEAIKISSPVDISMAREKLNIIVGRNRKF
jgi:diacylglycerol kinase family enzyme